MSTEPPLVIGVSACLLGERYRYDGTDRRHDRLIAALGHAVTWVSVCPEVELGLGVPRERIQLVQPRVGQPVRLVTEESRRDITAEMEAWADARAAAPDVAGVCGFVLKSRSPSCGLAGVKVHEAAGPDTPSRAAGRGLFAAALVRRYPALPVIDADELDSGAAIAAFAARARAYRDAH